LKGHDGRPVVAPTPVELFLSFLRLGAVSFGGPGMVAYIHRLAVERRGWLAEEEFRQGVALCQAVPGATAMQCAAFVGLRARRLAGAAAAYVGFGLPAFLFMLALAFCYRHAVEIDAVRSALTGLRALVVGLLANATWSLGRSSIRGRREGEIAAAAATLFLLGASPFLIVAGAGLAGAVALRGPAGPPSTSRAPSPGWASLRRPALVLAAGAVLVAALSVHDRRLAELGLVMLAVDAFAFGGGFASLPLLYHQVVDAHGWMPAGVFMDGVALGQVTPGPIVITATFVGFYTLGLAGAVAATACIFLPSFFAVVLVEPWFRWLSFSLTFRGATRALLLSFVGLLASVTVRLALLVPWTAPAGAIAGLALLALLLGVDVLWVVLAGAAVAAAIP
jgi:chromate transporter